MDWHSLLLGWKEKLEDRLHSREVEAVLDWVKRRGELNPNECLEVGFEVKEYFFLESGAWKKRSAVPKNTEIAFVAGLPNNKKERELWFPLFQSRHLTVYERKNRHDGKHKPLRFGLSTEEKDWVLKQVRQMVKEALQGKVPSIPTDPFGRFSLIQDLDVAAWVKGKMRASVIETGKSCLEALRDAAIRIPKDTRFEPLTLAELPEARIEITFMSDLHIPITREEHRENEVDPTKGYYGVFHKKLGWYLPEVHNVISFRNLEDLCHRLASQKAKIRSDETVHYSSFSTFEVFDWIESSNGPLSLVGPTPTMKSSAPSREEIENVLERATRALIALQESSGYIPAILSPKDDVRKTEDLVRLACTGHALALYGASLGHHEALAAARLVKKYLESAQSNQLDKERPVLLDVYLGRLKLALGEALPPEKVNGIQKMLNSKGLNTIGYLQGLTFLLESEKNIGERFDFVSQKATQLFNEFERSKEKSSTQLAFYPELYAILLALSKVSNAETWLEKAKEMANWYKGKQLPDGSFPHSPGRAFAYTRGTGKIFEVLALDPEGNGEALSHVWRWIETMQYDEENTFHITEVLRPKMIGLFRHDAFNREAWIDASAHILLGGTRWLTHEE